MAITSAVKECHNSGVNVKSKIGNDLIRMLDQIFKLYYQEEEECLFDHELRTAYEYLHKKLEFPVDDETFVRMTYDRSGGFTDEV